MSSLIQELRDDIADLELQRDSADKERECFAVRKAKDADELRERIMELEQFIFDRGRDYGELGKKTTALESQIKHYASQCARHEKTIGDLRKYNCLADQTNADLLATAARARKANEPLRDEIAKLRVMLCFVDDKDDGLFSDAERLGG